MIDPGAFAGTTVPRTSRLSASAVAPAPIQVARNPGDARVRRWILVAGTAALEVCSEWKSIYVDVSGRLQRAQIDTQDL